MEVNNATCTSHDYVTIIHLNALPLKVCCSWIFVMKCVIHISVCIIFLRQRDMCLEQNWKTQLQQNKGKKNHMIKESEKKFV
jgi:hypothetical protein